MKGKILSPYFAVLIINYCTQCMVSMQLVGRNVSLYSSMTKKNPPLIESINIGSEVDVGTKTLKLGKRSLAVLRRGAKGNSGEENFKIVKRRNDVEIDDQRSTSVFDFDMKAERWVSDVSVRWKPPSTEIALESSSMSPETSERKELLEVDKVRVNGLPKSASDKSREVMQSEITDEEISNVNANFWRKNSPAASESQRFESPLLIVKRKSSTPPKFGTEKGTRPLQQYERPEIPRPKYGERDELLKNVVKRGTSHKESIKSEKLEPTVNSRRVPSSGVDIHEAQKPKEEEKEHQNNKNIGFKSKKSIFHTNGVFDVEQSKPKGNERLNDEPVVASSLAFVFDVTSSMRPELTFFKEKAAQILKTIRTKNLTPIADYILVPFQDPNVGPLMVSTDHEEFLRWIKRITVFGGGDCPEMTLGGIILALQKCRPHSFVYVFTDARSKDYEKVDQLLSLIQEKQTQVVFIMTGNCNDASHAGYLVFKEIAAKSSGQVYDISKSNVQEVMDSIIANIQLNKVNLLAIDRTRPEHNPENYELVIDKTLKEFTISLTGTQPQISVVDPQGHYPETLLSLLDLENVKVVNVKKPDPGVWKLYVYSSSPYTIRSTGLSNIDFMYGFSTQPAKALVETSHRPLKGTENSILIQTAPENIQNLTTVCFLNVHGEILQTLILQLSSPKEGIYCSDPFRPTDSYFFVGINGFSKDGTPLKRITPTAISPQLPAAPGIQPTSNFTVFEHQDVILKCHVKSLVPFSIRWFKNDHAVGHSFNYNQTAETEWKIPRIQIEDEGCYVCRADNVAGFAIQKIYLTVIGKPPVVTVNEHIISMPDLPSILRCDVESSVSYNVTWSKGVSGETRYWKKIIPSGKYIFEKGNQLIIPSTLESDEGWYQCYAQSSAGSGTGKLYLSVKEEPSIRVEPQSIKVSSNGSFSLSCYILKGTPLPQLRWWKNNQTIFNGWRSNYNLIKNYKRLDLRVHSMRIDDSGLFTCQAVNDLNMVSSQVEVEYVESPKVVLKETSVLAQKGDHIHLECHVTGFPQPKVFWFKDGQLLEKNSNIVQVMDNLNILSANLSDSGEYSCVAENSEGSHVASVFLTVGVPPHISNEGAIIDHVSSIIIGKDVEFKCIVDASPNPDIVWSRDGFPGFLNSSRFQVSNDSKILKIIETLLEDEGRYVCTAKNIFGEKTVDFLLKIIGTEMPNLEGSQHPVISAEPGDDVNLSCTLISGKPQPVITWYHDDSPINFELPRYQQHKNGSLSILEFEKLDQGLYFCIAQNPLGFSKKVYQLQMFDPPRFEENAQSQFTVLAGETIVLPCKVLSDLKTNILWQKDGFPLNFSDRLSMDGDDFLIKEAQLGDKGKYTCTAFNSVGSGSRVISLDVLAKPEIKDELDRNIILSQGENFKIPCTATGIPVPDIIWKKDGEIISTVYDNEKILKLPDNSLILNDVVKLQSGHYECIASNKAGNASRSYFLTVNDPPRFKENVPSSFHVVAGENVTLPCSVISDLKIDMLWQKNNFPLNSSSRLSMKDDNLVISNAQIDDKAMYICTAVNSAGSASRKMSLDVSVKPEIKDTHETNIILSEGNDYKIPCSATGIPNPDIFWKSSGNTLLAGYNDEEMLVLPDNSLVLSSVTGKMSGNYECVAKNRVGTASRMYTVIINALTATPKSALNIPIVDVETIESTPALLECPLNSSSPPSWSKDGTNLDNFKSERSDMPHFSLIDQQRIVRISESVPSDSGEYICQVENNDLGGRQIAIVRLNVIFAPLFEEEIFERNISLVEGEKVRLDCAAEGNPQPKVQWRLRNKDIQITEYTFPGIYFEQPFKHGLVIQQANHSEHEGQYQCSATNKLGTLTRNYNVIVIRPPEIKDSSLVENISSSLQQEIILKCSILNTPEVKITWLHNGTAIMGKLGQKIEKLDDSFSKYSLIVPISSNASAGRYTCFASNEAGITEKNFYVVVPQL